MLKKQKKSRKHKKEKKENTKTNLEQHICYLSEHDL